MIVAVIFASINVKTPVVVVIVIIAAVVVVVAETVQTHLQRVTITAMVITVADLVALPYAET